MNYRTAVEALASSRDDMRFDNEGFTHAASVIEMMFKYNDEVRFFSGSMNSDVTDEPNFMESLNSFLEEDKKLYLFVENIPDEENQSNALKKILSHAKKSEHVIVKQVSEAFREDIRKLLNGNLWHFSIGDDRSYRMEYDPTTYKAVCSYNRPERVTELLAIFNKHFFNSIQS